MAIAARSLLSVLLIGDSLVNGLARYHRVWSKYFEPLRALNFGVGGDRTQHVLWRIENGEIPLNLQVAFVHCGTNNLDRDNPAEIRDGIASIVYTIQEKKPNANFIVSGLLARDQETSSRREEIKLVNQKLREWCRSGRVRNVYYLKPDKDWTEPDGRLVERYYLTDFLHLVEEGYEKFAKSIYEAIVNVSRGNVVDLVKDRKRSRNKSGSTAPPPKTQQKQSGQATSTTFTTTVLPRPKPTATLPPPTAIAPKLNGTTTHCTTHTITCPYTNTETTATDTVIASPTTHTVTATPIDNTFTSTLTDTATPTTTVKDTTTHLTTPTDNTSAAITTNTPTPLTDMTAPADTTNNLIPQTDITAKDTTDSVITTDITTNPTDITASTITSTEMDTMTADTNTTNHPHNITNFRYFRTFLIHTFAE